MKNLEHWHSKKCNLNWYLEKKFGSSMLMYILSIILKILFGQM